MSDNEREREAPETVESNPDEVKKLSSPVTFSNLPFDLTSLVLGFLTFQDRGRLAQASKKSKEISDHNSFWGGLLKKKYISEDSDKKNGVYKEIFKTDSGARSRFVSIDQRGLDALYRQIGRLRNSKGLIAKPMPSESSVGYYGSAKEVSYEQVVGLQRSKGLKVEPIIPLLYDTLLDAIASNRLALEPVIERVTEQLPDLSGFHSAFGDKCFFIIAAGMVSSFGGAKKLAEQLNPAQIVGMFYGLSLAQVTTHPKFTENYAELAGTGIPYELYQGAPERVIKHVLKSTLGGWERIGGRPVTITAAAAAHALSGQLVASGSARVVAKEAIELLKFAATRNYAPAQVALGMRYENGDGVVKDIKEAEKFYQLAAKQGYIEAGACLEALRSDLPESKAASSSSSSTPDLVPATPEEKARSNESAKEPEMLAQQSPKSLEPVLDNKKDKASGVVQGIRRFGFPASAQQPVEEVESLVAQLGMLAPPSQPQPESQSDQPSQSGAPKLGNENPGLAVAN